MSTIASQELDESLLVFDSPRLQQRKVAAYLITEKH